MCCQEDFISILAPKRLELPLDHTEPIICIQGVAGSGKSGWLGSQEAVSLSLKVCSRGCLFTRALASVSSMRVWLWIICARSVKGGGGGGGCAPRFSPLP